MAARSYDRTEDFIAPGSSFFDWEVAGILLTTILASSDSCAPKPIDNKKANKIKIQKNFKKDFVSATFQSVATLSEIIVFGL